MKPELFLRFALGTAFCFLHQASAQTIEVTSTGVGIGTASPTRQLSLYKQYPELVLKSNAASGGTGGGTLYFGNIGSDSAAWVNYNHASNSLDVRVNEVERLRILSNGNVGIGTTSPVSALTINGQLSGGLGAQTTGGVTNWNDVSNTRSGSGYSLLAGNATNGPGPAAYFHPFNFEYNSKDGSGSITQLAIPYSNTTGIDQGIWMRGRYWTDPWTPWVRIISENTAGNVGIGTTTPGYKLEVVGSVRATSFIANSNTYADFVFKPGYQLRSLSEVEAAIKANGHLPDIPSEAEAKARGIDLAAMQVKLLQKVEELTLYLVAHEKTLQTQQQELQRLHTRNETLEREVAEFEKR